MFHEALPLFQRMKDGSGVYLDAETYTILIGSIAEAGGFR